MNALELMVALGDHAVAGIGDNQALVMGMELDGRLHTIKGVEYEEGEEGTNNPGTIWLKLEDY